MYSLSLQIEIISIVRECNYISIIDYFVFFYQWKMHSKYRHKFIVVIHREQKSFNVAIINYKNSSIYVQRQINRLFRAFRYFARIYVDDIIIFSKTKKKHETHLREIFVVLTKNNIFIKFTKTFFDYSLIFFLNQKIDSFELIISKKKLKIIFKLFFSKTLQILKIYLNLTNWLRNYVFIYVDVAKFLQ